MANCYTNFTMPRNIRLLYLINFFSAFRFYTPIFVIYFAQVTGSYTLAMTIVAADSLFTGLFEIPTGVFSDLIGRKSTTILSHVASILCMAFWAFGGSFEYLLIGAFFGGLSGALSSGNDEALMYDSLKEVDKQNDYHNYYSKWGSYTLIAFGISALLGGFMAGISFQLVFWISVLFSFFALIFSLFLHQPPESKKVEINPYKHLGESIQTFIHNPRLRMLSLSNAISNSITESTYQFSPVFVNMFWPIWAVGVMKSSTNFLNAFSYFISGKVISKFKAFNALVGQFVVSRVVLIIAYTFPTVLSPALMASTSLIYGIGQVSQKTLMQREFTDHQRATMGSLNSLLTSIFFTTISISIGFLADILGARNILLIGEILLIPVLFIYWRLFLHNRKAPTD